ncbi:DNA repair protein RadC [Lachnospiraceae bacterium A10]|nr:DNA repair protein RadC [Lachnospiraceae bacterium A10]
MANTSLKNRNIVLNPYKKCMKYGPEALSDDELLAIVLRTGTKDMDAIELAKLILDGKQDCLLNLIYYSRKELMAFPGIGDIKSMELKVIAEIANRIHKCKRRERILLGSSKSVANYYMEQLRHRTQEHVVVALFDAKGHLLLDKTITIGTLTLSLFPPRDIFLFALQEHAAFFVVLHNHPSGDPSPSKEDIQATEKIREAGDLLSVPLVDHIIIGDMTYYSFREHGLVPGGH